MFIRESESEHRTEVVRKKKKPARDVLLFGISENWRTVQKGSRTGVRRGE